MLSGKSAPSFRVKNWVRGSSSLQWAYTRLATTAGRWQVRRGSNLTALNTLLPAWRIATRVSFGSPGVAAIQRVIRRTCFRGDRLAPASDNALVTEFLQTPEARRIRETFGRFPLDHRVRLRFPKDNHDPERQGNLILLKRHRPETGEKGVIFIKYSASFPWFVALYDLSLLASRYTIVLEPCWVGYQDWRFLLYLGCDLDVVLFAPYPPDFAFIQGLNSNLIPMPLGAGDWVDPDTFRAGPENGRSFDLVMVSAWNPVKRHDLLFQTLAELKRRGYPDLRAALVGYPNGWTRRNIESLMRRYGVADQCVIFEGIPHGQVAEVVADSRVFLLLSDKEGTNKAVYESLFCNTPVIVNRNHQGGVMRDHFPTDVGFLASDEELADTILRVLKSTERFRPREWALSHTGWPSANERLDKMLEELACRRGQPWDHPIAPKKNSPNLMYAEKGRYREFDEEYRGLEGYLR
jgi:glycosyltransferase involved in cell wall biosynthesis